MRLPTVLQVGREHASQCISLVRTNAIRIAPPMLDTWVSVRRSGWRKVERIVGQDNKQSFFLA